MMNKHINLLVVLVLVIISFTLATVYQISEINAAGTDDFVTTWQTNNPGTSADNQITIPTFSGGYNYNVDWGDGTSDAGITGDITHTYDAPGQYQVRISGDFPRIYFNNSGDKDKIVSIDQWGTISWSSMSIAFFGCSNLDVNATDAPDLSNVTDISYMFARSGITTPDFSNWDTSNVERMRFTFQSTAFNGDITTWNVSNVTTMDSMFRSTSAFNQPIGVWNTSSLSSVSDMFREAVAFNQPLNNWDVTGISSMYFMFTNAPKFNQDLDEWDVSNLNNASYLFAGADSFNGDISNWNVSNVTNMQDMFSFNEGFNSDISGWNVSSVTNMGSMFEATGAFNVDISGWNVSSVTRMDDLFKDAVAFDQDISGWDVTSVTNAHEMLDHSGFSTKNYDVLLIEWSDLTLQNNVTFTADDVSYCHGEEARQSIVSTYNWSITDEGLDCTEANKFASAVLVDGLEVGEVDENLDAGSSVGLLTAEDEDEEDSHSFVLGCETPGADQGAFALDGENILWTNEVFNFEEAADADGDNVYELCFVVTDDGKPNLTTELNVNIEVQNVNEVPVSLTLRDGTNITDFKERRDSGSTVGALVTDDNGEENPNGFVYSLACENEGPDDEYFATNGSNLISDFLFYASTPRDVNEDNIYEICVRTTDDGGLSLDANFMVEILSIGTQGGSASAGSGGGSETTETTETSNVENDVNDVDETTSEEEVFEDTELVKEDDTEDSSETTSGTQAEEGEEFYEEIVTEENTSSGGGGGGSNNLDVLDFDIETTNVTRGEFMKLILDVYYEKTGESLERSGTEPFPDVDPSYTNYWYVVEAYEMGIIRGDMGFAYVNRELNRVEALAMVLRVVGIDYEDYRYTLAYSDVDPSKWYAPVIEAAKDEGLVMWGEGNTFRPGMTLVDTEVERLLEETMSRLD